MLKAFKTEIYPTEDQKTKIRKTIGTCRYIYNLYLMQNKRMYQLGQPFMDGYAFSRWLNNEFLPANPDKSWIKDVSSKAVKQSVMNAYRAFQRFFRKESGYPSFKKKGISDPSMYFVRNNPTDCRCERHRIKVPTLGWVRLKEKGYIPVTAKGYTAKSGTISMKAGRYYVSVLMDVQEPPPGAPKNPGIGIDLGIKALAVVSDGTAYPNINKSLKIRKLEKRLKREQRRLSRKYENRKKGKATQFRNIGKQKAEIQKLYHRLERIRTDHVNKTVAAIVKTKPSYVAIEDLNVSGMMRNKHLSKAIAAQKIREFRTKLTTKAHCNRIEVRVVDRFYPSSKLCHACGERKNGLKLSERTFRCDTCGHIDDRDHNASLNLRDAMQYVIA